MVRRAAAHNLGRFAERVEPPCISRELIPLFQDLTVDGETRTFSLEWSFACPPTFIKAGVLSSLARNQLSCHMLFFL